MTIGLHPEQSRKSNMNEVNGEVKEIVDQPKFYVVSEFKFTLLFFGTLGLYQIYWFWNHWNSFKHSTKTSMIPILRAIFSIFFTHSLTREINSEIVSKGIDYKWDPGVVATWVVILNIYVFRDRMATKEFGSPYTDIVGSCCYLFYTDPC